MSSCAATTSRKPSCLNRKAAGPCSWASASWPAPWSISCWGTSPRCTRRGRTNDEGRPQAALSHGGRMSEHLRDGLADVVDVAAVQRGDAHAAGVGAVDTELVAQAD